MHRNHHIRHPGGISGWGPAPGWGQPFPSWSPLMDNGPPPLRAASSVARWWWPSRALAGFSAVAGLVLAHDQAASGLSTRGLVTIALAALVVVLLTIHRATGPGPLVRAVAEFAVVAVLAGLLVADVGGVDQPPPKPATSAAKTEARQAARTIQNLEAGEDRPGVLRVAAAVARAVTKAIRAVTGAAGWLVELWRQADQRTDRPGRSAAPTRARPAVAAIGHSPTSPPPTRRPL